jgi:hypothetical protein
MRDFSLVFLIMAVIPLLSLPVLARLGQEAGRVAAKAPEPEPAGPKRAAPRRDEKNSPRRQELVFCHALPTCRD